jgi:hypothetical protein
MRLFLDFTILFFREMQWLEIPQFLGAGEISNSVYSDEMKVPQSLSVASDLALENSGKTCFKPAGLFTDRNKPVLGTGTSRRFNNEPTSVNSQSEEL